MIIKDFSSLKKFFLKIKIPILGAGVYAFTRIGPEEFVKDYRILSLYFSKETELIKRDIETFCLEEKIGKKIKPKNSRALLSHPLTLNYLSKFRNPLILVYKSSKKLERLARKYRLKIALSPSYFGKNLFENKIKFREILKKIGLSPTPARIVFLSSILRSSYSDLKNEFGIPFVLQHPQKGGGKGTFFIKTDLDFKEAKKFLLKDPAKKIIVSKFIKGPSPSITGCVSSFGIFSTRPQYQICDIPILYKREIGSGLFSGHDFSASDFSKKILNQAKEIVEKIGNYFKRQGYRGIFGLDFVLDQKEERLYLTECNPRLLGTFPTLTMIQIENNEVPILALHLLEFLKVPCQVDQKKINYLMWQKKQGAQMICHNPLGKEAIQKGEISPGSYGLKGNKLKLTKEIYSLKNLKRDEFLLTEGLQEKNSKIRPYQRIFRVLTKKRVLDKNLKEILPETKFFLKKVISRLKIKNLYEKEFYPN